MRLPIFTDMMSASQCGYRTPVESDGEKEIGPQLPGGSSGVEVRQTEVIPPPSEADDSSPIAGSVNIKFIGSSLSESGSFWR